MRRAREDLKIGEFFCGNWVLRNICLFLIRLKLAEPFAAREICIGIYLLGKFNSPPFCVFFGLADGLPKIWENEMSYFFS